MRWRWCCCSHFLKGRPSSCVNTGCRYHCFGMLMLPKLKTAFSYCNSYCMQGLCAPSCTCSCHLDTCATAKTQCMLCQSDSLLHAVSWFNMRALEPSLHSTCTACGAYDRMHVRSWQTAAVETAFSWRLHDQLLWLPKLGMQEHERPGPEQLEVTDKQ